MNYSTKQIVKNALLWGGAFVAYRLYKLWEVSDSVVYKPVGVTFVRNKTVNDFIIRVKIELLNPTKTTVKTSGLDGKLIVASQPIASFVSNPFDILPGLSYFDLDFKVDAKYIGTAIIKAIQDAKTPVLNVVMNVKLPYFNVTEKFSVSLPSVPKNQIFVR